MQMANRSFILILVLVMFFLFLPLDLAVLRLVVLFFLGGLDLVLLILCLKAGLNAGVNLGPHITDDPSDLGNFSGWVLGPHAIIDFPPIKEKSGECTLGCRWLR